jgi:hypothetical protein
MNNPKGLTANSFRTKRNRSSSAAGCAGRKRHGSHRSTIIGKYQFKSSPVTSLKQAGVIWTTV